MNPYLHVCQSLLGSAGCLSILFFNRHRTETSMQDAHDQTLAVSQSRNLALHR